VKGPREQQYLTVAGRVGAGVEVERRLGRGGMRVRGRIGGGERQEDGGVVGKALPHARPVVADLDPGGAQVVGGTDAGAQQQVRGADGAGREHDLVGADLHAVTQADADRAVAVEQQAVDVGVAAYGAVVQVGHGRVDPQAVDGVARHQPRAR
jgi:hypothetical protein